VDFLTAASQNGFTVELTSFPFIRKENQYRTVLKMTKHQILLSSLS
jgi:hypothetical protein